jgi:hypothetical protein
MHHIASKQDGLSVPIRAPLPENMPRGAMRASPAGTLHARARFTRAPATRGRITREGRAVHADMRNVLGLEDAPAHWPATGGAQGQQAIHIGQWTQRTGVGMQWAGKPAHTLPFSPSRKVL